MKTFYLVDFENVGEDGIKNIESIKFEDEVHIFSTEKAPKINTRYISPNNITVKWHLVPLRKQSVDMHIVSYLGYFLCENGNECSYVIVSNDTDYDNIINFWKKEKAYARISKTDKIPAAKIISKTSNIHTKSVNSTKKAKNKVSLADYVQKELRSHGINDNASDTIAEIVVSHHKKDKNPLDGIYNDIKKKYNKKSGEKYCAQVEKIYNSFLKSISESAV